MEKNIDIKTLLSNAISQYEEDSVCSKHILSDITTKDALLLVDETNTLKIFTNSNDIFTLSHNEWIQSSSNDEDGFATYCSTLDDKITLLIDELVVDII
ncbi:hypothetical protein [Halarcobacter ebronensis]|uniref:Uncharacterized protein n=1 Tax=Halarcobacter ebronensis TaxID=1462615 RepID=A0A4Q1APU3_9BACT|nr:hypothetical protein [Halarcobacter ebronensis]QKF82685.1 hypothetical protein AEBR_2217 [Halarcobacter ebronensis]RXK06712.1 hypothetical protein CRV07_04595 [Halarcobacter ebronensis]